MSRFFRSNFRQVIRFHDRAAHNALTAAAVVVRNQAKRNVRGGFRSGKFVTGNLFNKIEHVVILKTLTAEIGTVEPYGAYWELGHHNKWTRRYEREEWLKPAFETTKRKQQEAAAKAIRRTGNRVLGSLMTGAGLRTLTRVIR